MAKVGPGLLTSRSVLHHCRLFRINVSLCTVSRSSYRDLGTGLGVESDSSRSRTRAAVRNHQEQQKFALSFPVLEARSPCAGVGRLGSFWRL